MSMHDYGHAVLDLQADVSERATRASVGGDDRRDELWTLWIAWRWLGPIPWRAGEEVRLGGGVPLSGAWMVEQARLLLAALDARHAPEVRRLRDMMMRELRMDATRSEDRADFRLWSRWEDSGRKRERTWMGRLREGHLFTRLRRAG